MNFDQPNLKQEENAKTLEEILPFLKQSDDNASFNAKLKNLGGLIGSRGNINNVLQMASKLRGEQPEEKKFTNEEREKFLSVRASIAEQLGYKVLENKGKQFTLGKEDFTIYLKHFMSPSFASYKSGRISQIDITSKKDKEISLEYHGDKVEGLKKSNEEMKKIFNELMKYFN